MASNNLFPEMELSGWLAANGQSLSMSQYSGLFNVMKGIQSTVSIEHTNGERREYSHEDLRVMIEANDEIKTLMVEVPAVKEAYDKLMTLIKLYRE